MTIPNDGYADGGESYTDEELELIELEEIQNALNENISEILYCPLCDSNDNQLLGILGDLIWLRCTSCGWEFNINKDEVL